MRLAERERLNKMIGDELLNSISNTGDIRPTNVTRRLSEDALYAKYLKHADSADGGSSNQSSPNSVSDEIKLEPNSGSDDEPIEMSMQPGDMRLVYTGPRQKPSKPPTGPSLLKPMSQRKMGQCELDPLNIPVVRPEVGIKKIIEPTQVETVQLSASAQVSLGRLRLKAALCKAKDANKVQPIVQPSENNVQKKAPETAPLTVTIKCNTPSLSSSRSSDASSSGEVEFLKDEENPDELGKESFLRMFGLYTPEHTEHMMNRRPQRKRRQCTSTERGDFHYGKFELFERQFAKRNKQFLYSPPATRAKRRIGSNRTITQPREPVIMPKRARGIKSNASSSSSLSSNGSNNGSESQRVCLTCYKRSEYHLFCHFCIKDFELFFFRFQTIFCNAKYVVGNIMPAVICHL